VIDLDFQSTVGRHGCRPGYPRKFLRLTIYKQSEAFPAPRFAI